MKLNMEKELAALESMTVGQLHERYVEVFGEPVRSRHKKYLIRRIAWRIQANAEGGLSERALRRAEELVNVADVRVTPPRRTDASDRKPQVAFKSGRVGVSQDSRIPQAGSQITRNYKGRAITVTVLDDGFEYLGERYRSLTAVAKTITGSHINGFRFFGLGAKA
ncbi:MAG TPA: DUF2924 domain-containing protein [Phycisphaerae bacterium]|nr:DUF2924 domain-containing protein [Phycisphaerae bacterium]